MARCIHCNKPLLSRTRGGGPPYVHPGGGYIAQRCGVCGHLDTSRKPPPVCPTCSGRDWRDNHRAEALRSN